MQRWTFFPTAVSCWLSAAAGIFSMGPATTSRPVARETTAAYSSAAPSSVTKSILGISFGANATIAATAAFATSTASNPPMAISDTLSKRQHPGDPSARGAQGQPDSYFSGSLGGARQRQIDNIGRSCKQNNRDSAE